MAIDIDNLVNFLVPVIVLVGVFLLPVLLGGGSKQRRRQKLQERQQRLPQRQAAGDMEQPDLYAGDNPLYFDLPVEQAPAQQKKKKKKKPVVQTEGKPAAEVPLMQKAVPDKGHKASFPVFSDNPVINGIIWSEVLTRGGTKRKLPY